MREPAPDAATSPAFNDIDPSELEFGLHSLLEAYQSSRSGLRAWLVVRYAEALCRHPAFEGSDEQRCAYHRLAQHWRWLAMSSEPPRPGVVA